MCSCSVPLQRTCIFASLSSDTKEAKFLPPVFFLPSILFSVCMLTCFPSYVLLPFFFHGIRSFFFPSLRHPFRLLAAPIYDSNTAGAVFRIVFGLYVSPLSELRSTSFFLPWRWVFFFFSAASVSRPAWANSSRTNRVAGL